MPEKYQLETIPVWEAIGLESECLLCDLEAESERRNTEFFLGSSVMAPEMRVELNKHGFCPRHFHMLGAGTGKLGYALALATHIDDLIGRISARGRRIISAGSRRNAAGGAASELADFLDEQEHDCLMCDRIRRNMRNYSYTIVKLFQTETEFRTALAASRGLCLHHLPIVLQMGVLEMRPAELEAWHQTILGLVAGSLGRLSEELEQFTWQFDATSDRRTPESARDAVARAIAKLAGFGPR